jgi:hypothetical protein
LRLVRYADRPDLRERRGAAFAAVFPEYMSHCEQAPLAGDLYDAFAAFQQAPLDGDELVAEAHALPLESDGTVEGLPAGLGGGLRRMARGREPTALAMGGSACYRRVAARAREPDALGLVRGGPRRRPRRGSSDAEGALPPDADRRVRGLEAPRRLAFSTPGSACTSARAA